jgi:hypothetical protein
MLRKRGHLVVGWFADKDTIYKGTVNIFVV